jgi:hypothetical protein
VNYPCNRQWRPIGLWDIKTPTFSRQSTHRWRQGCQPLVPAALYSTGIFLVLISVKGRVNPRAIVLLEGLCQLKNSMTPLWLNPQLSSLWHSASTNYATTCPLIYGYWLFRITCCLPLQQVPLTCTKLHVITSQETIILMLASMWIPDRT